MTETTRERLLKWGVVMARIVIGALFVISGITKDIDLWGTVYKNRGISQHLGYAAAAHHSVYGRNNAQRCRIHPRSPTHARVLPGELCRCCSQPSWP